MKICLQMVVVAALLILPAGSFGDEIAKEDFDGGAVNLTSTTNVHNYPSPLGGDFGDVFAVVNPAHLGGDGMPRPVADDTVANVSGFGVNAGDVLGVAGSATGAFFAMDDMDGVSLPGFTFATWSFDISSAVGGLTDIQIDIGAMGDFETSSIDGLRIEAQIDGGGYQTIFLARPNEAISKTYRPLDGGLAQSFNDPLELFIDGSGTAAGTLDKSDPLTGRFDTWTSILLAEQTGSMLDIRVSWEGTAEGGEPMAIDNITINGVANADPILPDSYKLADGVLVSGGITDLHASDDSYFETDPSPTMNLLKQRVDLIVQSQSPTATPSALSFRVESKMIGGPSGDVIQFVELFNYATNTRELVDTRPAANSDESIEIAPGGDLSRFVNPINREITGFVTWKSESFAKAMFTWSLDIDETVWFIDE